MVNFSKMLILLLVVLLALLTFIARGPFVIVVMFVATVLIAAIIGISKIRVIGLELSTFTGVLTGLVYDPFVGAVVGSVMILTHMLVAQYVGPYIFWVIPSYAIGTYVAAAVGSTGNLVGAGIIAIVLINGINLMFTFVFSRDHVGQHLPYLVSNIVISFILFSTIGSVVLNLF